MSYKRVRVRKRVTKEDGDGLSCYRCEKYVHNDPDVCPHCGCVVFVRGHSMSRVIPMERNHAS